MSSSPINSGAAAPANRQLPVRRFVLPVVREVPLPPPDAGTGGGTW
jgi:hypothetical protein